METLIVNTQYAPVFGLPNGVKDRKESRIFLLCFNFPKRKLKRVVEEFSDYVIVDIFRSEDIPLISLKYANGLRNGANSDTHRCKQLTEHGEERCNKLREVAGFSAVRTIFQIVGPRKILHCLLGK